MSTAVVPASMSFDRARQLWLEGVLARLAGERAEDISDDVIAKHILEAGQTTPGIPMPPIGLMVLRAQVKFKAEPQQTIQIISERSGQVIFDGDAGCMYFFSAFTPIR
jgi:hypothetical protein